MREHSTPTADALKPSEIFRAGTEMPPGSVGWHIDCSDNPLDLRPAADLILRAIDETRAQLPTDRPLVVLMGEAHSMPTHKELQHLVARRLLGQGENFVVCSEWAHDKWEKLSRQHINRDFPQGVSFPASLSDPDGRAALSLLMGYWDVDAAPLSDYDVMAFLYERGIKTVFNDASINILGYLDMKDDLTRAEATAVMGQNASCLYSTHALAQTGIVVRNRVMARLGLEFARAHQANFVMQFTGFYHVFGGLPENFSYDESLSLNYQRAGAVVLPIFITSRAYGSGVNILEPEACKMLGRSVVIDGLAESQFASKLGNLAGERGFITDIHAACGGELDFHDVTGKKEFYRERARVHVQEAMQLYALKQQQPGFRPAL